MNPRLFVALAIATSLATSWYACGGSGGSSNSSPTSPSTSSATMFEGTIAGSSGQSGTFAVTIQTAIAASSASSYRSTGFTIRPLSFSQVSGSLALTGGGTVPLTGTFDSTTNGVNLSGGGFTFTGTISGAVLSGTYTGPSGNGVFSSLNASQTSVTAYCGAWRDRDSGVFNLQVSANGAVSGDTFDITNGETDTLNGQLNGTALSLMSGGGGSGTGTIQTGTVNGTWNSKNAGTGSFAGSTGACSVPTPPPVASGVGFIITTNVSPGSFTASLQNETLTATGDYNFILAPGVYTISGQVLGVGGLVSGGSYTLAGLNITFHIVNNPNCKSSSGCAGVAPGVQSSITGGLGNQSVSSCQVAYATFNPGCLPGNNGGCLSPVPSLNFQLQFTVTASAPVCQ